MAEADPFPSVPVGDGNGNRTAEPGSIAGEADHAAVVGLGVLDSDVWAVAECIACGSSFDLDELHPELCRCPACVVGAAA